MDAQTIQALAQAIREQTIALTNESSNETRAPCQQLKSPPFWTSNAKTWFVRLEAAFATQRPRITSDTLRFQHVIQLLDSDTSKKVQAIIQAPPASGKYEALKNALLKIYEPTQYQKDTELINITGLGDRKPTELLQHMRSLNTDPESLFKAFFVHQLPTNVRSILAQDPDTDLDTLAERADRIMEIQSSTPVSTVQTDGENTTLIHATNGPPRRAKPQYHKQGKTTNFSLCHYHSRFGKKAFKCGGHPCPMSGQGND